MVAPAERQEEYVERLVAYSIEIEGRFVIVENVPARVDMNTGEQMFSPATLERLQAMIRGGQRPARVVETPVYEFAG